MKRKTSKTPRDSAAPKTQNAQACDAHLPDTWRASLLAQPAKMGKMRGDETSARTDPPGAFNGLRQQTE
jgi:hypothetical protein